MTNNEFDKIITRWMGWNIKLSPAATPDDIDAVEKMLAFQFPPDFKEIYLRVDGFVDWDCTPDMFSIWPLARIVEEYHKEEDKTFIPFADYLINAHHFGFVKGESGVFKKYETEIVRIADSFSETIALINADAGVLY